MSLQKRGVQRRQRLRIGERARVLIDGPSGEHELVVKARLSTQAPDIDAAVYLTDCDPSSYRPGAFADVTIVGARDYDLIASARAIIFNSEPGCRTEVGVCPLFLFGDQKSGVERGVSRW